MRPKSRSGFTLVELLVVIGIIALLIGILLPTISRAFDSARRVTCRANLSQIGKAFNMYLNESRNHLPAVEPNPWNPIVPIPPAKPAQPVADVLGKYTGESANVWRCPSDVILTRTPSMPADAQTYFEMARTSYLYSPELGIGSAYLKFSDTRLWKRGRPDLIVICNDFEPYHGEPNTAGAMNYLFADSRVADIK